MLWYSVVVLYGTSTVWVLHHCRVVLWAWFSVVCGAVQCSAELRSSWQRCKCRCSVSVAEKCARERSLVATGMATCERKGSKSAKVDWY